MQEINGFKIVGEYWVDGKRRYKCNALCRVCCKEFLTNYHALPRMKSCGCDRPSQIKSLPKVINGFVVIKDLGYGEERKAVIECKVCGNPWEVNPHRLNRINHCGCIKKGSIVCRYIKSHPQLARTIKHMIGRCYNKNNQDYYNYGGRGITVCDEWIKDRNTFCEWSLANGFENDKGLSIDRIDNDKGYSPDNCRWAESKIQFRNTRRLKLTMDMAREIRREYKNMTKAKLAHKYMVSETTIWNVLNNKTWKDI